MAVRTKVEPLNRDIEVILAEDLSPKARSAALARFARETIDEAQEINRRALGRAPTYEVRVDGRHGAPLESVKPSGRIDVEFDLAADLFMFILQELRRLSPVRTGAYRDSHTFFADGVQANPANPPRNAREFSYVNLQPYARKIEVGRIKLKVPPGVYEAAARSASQRFAGQARIRFSYRTPASGAIASWAARARGGSGRTRPEWLRRQPAIVITF